jgi:hypothetical protein
MKNQNAISRDADKFVVRMPDAMRERVAAIAKSLHTSMNSAIVLGLNAWLDGLDDLNILLESIRLLKKSLEREKLKLEAERLELANLKAQFEAKMSSKGLL